jgi:hypothetical protein
MQKEPKKKKYKLTIQYFDPRTREMSGVDVLKTKPMTEAQWDKVMTRRLVEANLESMSFCYEVSTHRSKI